MGTTDIIPPMAQAMSYGPRRAHSGGGILA